jgi:hypothetical protein
MSWMKRYMDEERIPVAVFASVSALDSREANGTY